MFLLYSFHLPTYAGRVSHLPFAISAAVLHCCCVNYSDINPHCAVSCADAQLYVIGFTGLNTKPRQRLLQWNQQLQNIVAESVSIENIMAESVAVTYIINHFCICWS